MLGQSDAMKDCETIWKILEELWNASIPTCSESGDIFIPKDERFGQCSNDVLKTLHTLALFYAAQCLQRLGKDADAAECCRQCLRRQNELGTFSRAEMVKNGLDLVNYYTTNLRLSDAYELFCDIQQIVRDECAARRSRSSDTVESAKADSEIIEKLPDDYKEQFYGVHRDIGSFYATVLECARAMGGVARAEQDASKEDGQADAEK